jgi:hypothetical protein
MRVGDLIGVGVEKCVSLYCEVEKVTDEETTVWVINGEWQGVLSNDGVLRAYEGRYLKHVMPGVSVNFIGNIPLADRQYNDAIRYMNAYLEKPALYRSLDGLWYRWRCFVRNNVSHRAKRFWMACEAFKAVYQGSRRLESLEHDEIPF